MMTHRESPILTRTYVATDDFRPESGSAYVCRRSIEERSEHFSQWRPHAPDVLFVDIIDEQRDHIAVQVGNARPIKIALRSARQLTELWQAIARRHTYLDITGMRHSSWASLLRVAQPFAHQISAVYVEPDEYRMSAQPTENEIYDLSEKIEGIAPLPGFARLRDEKPTSCFIALLGFEGTRLLFMVAQLEPPGQRIFPVVGVPGFRAEYPFTTYLANRTALRDSQAWKKVRFAAANCPYEVYDVLAQLQREFPEDVLKIAPIGTKPHALGAVLFAIRNPERVELVYDHPVRKAKRTAGQSRLHVYPLGAILS